MWIYIRGRKVGGFLTNTSTHLPAIFMTSSPPTLHTLRIHCRPFLNPTIFVFSGIGYSQLAQANSGCEPAKLGRYSGSGPRPKRAFWKSKLGRGRDRKMKSVFVDQEVKDTLGLYGCFSISTMLDVGSVLPTFQKSQTSISMRTKRTSVTWFGCEQLDVVAKKEVDT